MYNRGDLFADLPLLLCYIIFLLPYPNNFTHSRHKLSRWTYRASPSIRHHSSNYLQCRRLTHQRDGALRILFGTPCDQPLRPPDSSIGSVCKAAAAAAAIAADGNADSDKCLMCDRGDLMAAAPLPVSATPPDEPARSIELPFLLIFDPLNPSGFLLSPGSCKFTMNAHFGHRKQKL